MNKLQGYIGQHRKYSQYFIITIHGVWDSQMALVVKNPHANAGEARDMSSIPGSERSPRKGNDNPLQYSCLENSSTEKPGGLQSIGSQRVRHS